MRYDAEGRKRLEMVELRASRKLAEIQELLVPGAGAPLPNEALREGAMRHMAELPPAEQEILRKQAYVAYAQLQEIIAELSQNLGEIGEELRKVNVQSQGVGTYGHVARKTGRRSPYLF